MIRLALARAPRSSIHSQRSLQHWSRTFSASTEEKPKGTPYEKLTVGIPKENFPLEKRVAATPEVSIVVEIAYSIFIDLDIDLNVYYLLSTNIFHSNTIVLDC